MFLGLLYHRLLAWLDDLLGYHQNQDGLLKVLNDVLAICADKGLKMHPKKCQFFVKEAKRCGRIISGKGVRHDPARVEALQQLSPPKTGAELQQYVCAINWMGVSIPGFNALVQPLTEILERVYSAAGGKRNKQSIVGINLEDSSCHPDPAQRVCVFADAFECHWGSVITQVPLDHLDRPLEAQHHQPLMFLSGTFTGAAKRWTIVEKEAYAIVETLVRADYLLHPASGFNLYTDHGNLKCIFNPTAVVARVPKYTAQKLERWALLLMGYKYVIEDISGETNVWADLLSRWGSCLQSACAISRQPLLVSPLQEQFEWPSLITIAMPQAEFVTNLPSDSDVHPSDNDSNHVFLPSTGIWQILMIGERLWIPPEASELLCICAHASLAGHRTAKSTLENVSYIAQVYRVVSPALLAKRHSDKPNGLIHWDFLFMGKSKAGDEYILVIKCDASKLIWLFPTAEATSIFVKESHLQWFAVFGICYDWVFDQGTHFENQVIAELQHSLGVHHHFTSAHCPWANGTVEVVMRQVLADVYTSMARDSDRSDAYFKSAALSFSWWYIACDRHVRATSNVSLRLFDASWGVKIVYTCLDTSETA
ncbi:hypothetical protein Ae201684_018400 [Aphanomyces euteiches]|uniref:Integrase catalytic domain-containing protein n=1 Tax=Aphanomyces euteiches TaxID=100861 RepID=A0A6G0W5W2_9STRA|nr:hypothetical protein Ae201684_018400 [Aphanomyces euteiches]